jgi:hypothetical protein
MEAVAIIGEMQHHRYSAEWTKALHACTKGEYTKSAGSPEPKAAGSSVSTGAPSLTRRLVEPFDTEHEDTRQETGDRTE